MSGEEWEVEKICNFRIKNNKSQYLIKWKGYDQEEWVDESNVNCPDLMEEYHAEHQEEIDKIKQKAQSDKKRPDRSESKEKEEEEEDQEEPEEKDSKKEKQKKEKKEKKPKKEEEEEKKPKKEKGKKKAEKEKPDKEKGEVIGFFKHKNKSYYTIKEKNGEIVDVPSNRARLHYPTKIIEYLESKLPQE